MNPRQITTSAALFFGPEQGNSITLRWFERARQFFMEHNLSPILFSADGGGFSVDDCCVLAELGGDIIDDEGYAIVARGADLIKALRIEDIEDLDMDSPRSLSGGRSDWRAAVSVSSTFGEFYIGIDEQMVYDPVVLLRRAYSITKGLLNVRYGIAYRMPLAEDPACYAIGRTMRFTASMFREGLRAKLETIHRDTKGADDRWTDELLGKRRHLTGLLRGAYPASILSESHLRAADLRSRGIGRLSELDASLWLWELSDSEVPVAEEALERLGVLVR